MAMNEEDRKYIREEIATVREDIKGIHQRLDPVCEQVATNKADIGWLKKSHWTFVGIVGTVMAAVVLFLIFGGNV